MSKKPIITDVEQIEAWNLLKYRIEDEGTQYCFESYSDWKEIKDEKFHRLREKFLDALSEIENYVDSVELEEE